MHVRTANCLTCAAVHRSWLNDLLDRLKQFQTHSLTEDIVVDEVTSGQDVAVDKGILIVNKAKEVAKAAADTAYTPGGKTLAGFDCSGFVYYVLQQVFPTYTYLTADGIATSSLFDLVTETQSGDIIYFPAGQNPYEVQKKNTREFPAHVGIIVDDQWWIGRQSSKLGLVQRTNVWWKSRTGVKYLRFSGAKQTSLPYMQHLSRLANA